MTPTATVVKPIEGLAFKIGFRCELCPPDSVYFCATRGTLKKHLNSRHNQPVLAVNFRQCPVQTLGWINFRKYFQIGDPAVGYDYQTFGIDARHDILLGAQEILDDIDSDDVGTGKPASEQNLFYLRTSWLGYIEENFEGHLELLSRKDLEPYEVILTTIVHDQTSHPGQNSW